MHISKYVALLIHHSRQLYQVKCSFFNREEPPSGFVKFTIIIKNTERFKRSVFNRYPFNPENGKATGKWKSSAEVSVGYKRNIFALVQR